MYQGIEGVAPGPLPGREDKRMRDMVVLISLDSTAGRAMARKLRAEHVYCRVLPAGTAAEEILRQEALGILLAGGSTGEPAAVPLMKDYLQSGLPMLCMGDAALTLCQTLGGTLGERAQTGGVAQVRFDAADALFEDVEAGERYLPAFRPMLLNASQGSVCAQVDAGCLGFRVVQRSVWGLAFPIERNDPSSTRLLLNFCHNVCGCTLWWSSQAFIERAREEIERVADGGDALCALSGGVDSGVCAMLGNMALGHRLHCIFVDTGLLRKDEGDQVMAFYEDQVGLNVRRIDAQEEFLSALQGVTDPLEKERIVHTHLRQRLAQEAAQWPSVRVILQGTNLTDRQWPLPSLSETSTGLRLLAPVRELFKDEIRHVGEDLGLPPAMIQRQPFPGSGLALRMLCEVTPERLRVLREADALFRREVEESGQNRRLWQYFASLAKSPLPDGGLVVTLRAVQAVEGTAAVAARLPSDLLEHVTQLILSRCPEVQRVLYDLTPSKSYAQVEWR